MKRLSFSLLLCLNILFINSCFLQLKPLVPYYGEDIKIEPKKTETTETETAEQKTDEPEAVFRFFDERFIAGGYQYAYPEESKVFIPEKSGKNGEVALQFDLIADDYSGGSVCLYNMLYDLRPYYSAGALEFWIKGEKGGEIAWAALVDDENSDGIKTVVRLPLENYGGISNEWKKISIPLADFGKRGVYWDAKKRVEIPAYLQWDKVAEYRLEIKMGDNPKFTTWVDDIFIVRDVYEPAPVVDEEYWDEREETIEPPPVETRPEVNVVHTIFKDDFPAGGFIYVYGGKTAFKIQPTTKKGAVLAMYQDNSDYSGVTVALGAGKNIDLTKERTTHAGLAFWAKAAPNVEKVYIGIIDDELDDKKVQTKIALSDFGKLNTDWNYFMIPIKRFDQKGKWWNAMKKAEILDDVKWNEINEIRFSINRYENKLPEGAPVDIYVDDITIIEDIPGYIDPDEYWAEFKSDKENILLHDFETPLDQKWETAAGEKSEISFEFIKPEDEKKYGNKCMQITYKLGDWCDIMYQYDVNNRSMEIRDWTKHWGLLFSFYSEKPYQSITVQINDSGDEIYVTNVGGQKGWSEILVPFKEFGKFPYYQPPGAREDGHFDLDSIKKIDFKPAGEGTVGKYRVDNVRLTNVRKIEKPKAAEEVAVTIKGNFEKVITENINDGIFGINVALWDGDLLKEATATYVKPVNHGVLRYPGGLRADEDHWKEVLDRKDWMVDTDEFLEFCKKTNTEAMITVNYGRGSPEEAAAWVKHVNVDKKANVRYWEVGNELYGDWHANHCTADEYGKKAAEFIKAMKKVDPSILVAVVWVLEGEWNKTVFKYTKDLADGVVIHHYPQHAGEENDFALLASPSSLHDIIPAVRRQIKENGTEGRKYGVWLTEWNSVDFNPGPQTLSVVNGLFVIDYLGTLAKHNIEQASYWDVHNDMTPEGGDYGYLSRTGAPDGDNATRPSYWAFRLASEALRGKIVESTSSNEYVVSYLTETKDNKKVLLIINKLPQTKAVVKLSIPGFTGKALVKEFAPENAAKGLNEKEIVLNGNDTITVMPYSSSALFLK